MNMLLPPDAFVATPDARGRIVDGLPTAIDAVAAAAWPGHRFLRRGWYAAAVAAYGGTARTVLVEVQGRPALALPVVAAGPAWLNGVSIPGSYWPFRGFPVAADAGDAVFDAALDVLAGTARVVRIGPVYDDDPAVGPLLAAARARGWTTMARHVAHGWRLDMGAQPPPWPRNSTLRKNRFHEKHLGAHGALDWRFLGQRDWPGGFALLGAVERKSWIASRTDGADAKFLLRGHGAFWREAARDPVLAGMMRAALLTIDGEPAAFSFDLETGATSYAIANSYDPAFAKHSPGKLLYWRNLVEARGRGVDVVDWGAGDSGYKQVIGAVEGPAMRDWLLVRPGWAARTARLLSPAWRRSGQRG